MKKKAGELAGPRPRVVGDRVAEATVREAAVAGPAQKDNVLGARWFHLPVTLPGLLKFYRGANQRS